MSRFNGLPATLREKSTWTPRNFAPSNEKIFHERMTLIKKWYAAWNETQRWTLLEFILKQLNDDQLTLIHGLLHPVMPPPDRVDFTRVLPRHLILRIFYLLDPQSLCRASQVCCYWKYMSECNEIWQEKCLKLGWFLPTPPQVYDYTAWKRHYIACVCQLHWNPPQAPEEEPLDDLTDGGALDLEDQESSKKKRKKKTCLKHSVTDEAKKPWRDPDTHPRDTYFSYTDFPGLYPGLTSASFSKLMLGTGGTTGLSQPTAQEIATHPLPPPSSLIHPTLLEKMRLGSPSAAHIELSTLNQQQSEQSISETFYRLHDTAPFPRLPPYYVHNQRSPNKSEEGSGYSSSAQHTATNSISYPRSRPPSGHERSQEGFVSRGGLMTNGRSSPNSRPPSGKSGASSVNVIAAKSILSGRTSPQQVMGGGLGMKRTIIQTDGDTVYHYLSNSPPKGQAKDRARVLASRPWNIPDEEELDDG